MKFGETDVCEAVAHNFMHVSLRETCRACQSPEQAVPMEFETTKYFYSLEQIYNHLVNMDLLKINGEWTEQKSN